jgi:hypothetical protein
VMNPELTQYLFDGKGPIIIFIIGPLPLPSLLGPGIVSISGPTQGTLNKPLKYHENYRSNRRDQHTG